MAIVCPACGTENRSVAKFCIECIAPLPSEFAATQVLAVPSHPADDMPSALAAFASSGPSIPSRPAIQLSTEPAALAAPTPRRGVGIGVAILVLLLVGAIGWLLAGANGWRGKEEREAPARQAAGVLEAAQPLPAAQAVAAEPAPTPVEALAPGESIVPLSEPPPAQPAAAVAAAAAPAPIEPPKAPAAAKPERPHAAFFARCEGLGFIANSRCKVDLCSQAASRQRKECEPVLAQQRLMEEKRNPTMLN